ncbi:putative Sin3 binding protein-domain-containing protein [Xylariaceae sp. FL1651]|nr:putative Sin3 binding protein-domain-containing protein [Xylariaceae sp. FL1651]
MATMASATAARDIPKTFQAGRDTLTGVAAARNGPVTGTHPLPTPPNSISPALPPHGLRAHLQKARLDPIDSDLDLHEDPDSSRAISPSFEAAGDITPTLLAKFHLPEILLNHGPLAIRHIMGYLTTSVPGFAGIPPPKARRLVVAALEGRGQGHSIEGVGVSGDVEFEKVGWGRWDARRRGQPARNAASRRSPGESRTSPYPTSIPISQGVSWNVDRSRLNARAASNGNSASFSHDDREASMLENEADKMSLDSLDEPGSASCSEAPDSGDIAMNDNPEDETDDEDWGAVGAAALRAGSYSSPAEARRGADYLSHRVHNTGGYRSFSANTRMLREPRLDNIDLDALAASSDAQEREARGALNREHRPRAFAGGRESTGERHAALGDIGRAGDLGLHEFLGAFRHPAPQGFTMAGEPSIRFEEAFQYVLRIRERSFHERSWCWETKVLDIGADRRTRTSTSSRGLERVGAPRSSRDQDRRRIRDGNVRRARHSSVYSHGGAAAAEEKETRTELHSSSSHSMRITQQGKETYHQRADWRYLRWSSTVSREVVGRTD